MNDAPILSAVVIGRNEGERLVRCLESVATMDPLGGPLEIIYVDSASTDGSVERANEFQASVVQVNPAHPCASIGRNAGWRAAHAAVILFLDGDTILAPDFVASAMDQFADTQVAVVFGNRREINTKGSIYNRVLDLDWIASPGPNVLCGGDALIRRSVLEQVGGYDERLIAGEDADLCTRIRALGYKIVYLDRRMVGHDLAIDRFWQYWRRSIRTGYAYAEISDRFRHSSVPVWSREARRNLIQGAAIVALIVGSASLSLAVRSLIPAAVASIIFMALVVRTSLRARWKCASFSTRLLYGLHSHFAQVPIMLGQFKYRRDRWTSRRAELIEYKDLGQPSQL